MFVVEDENGLSGHQTPNSLGNWDSGVLTSVLPTVLIKFNECLSEDTE